jgi:hypothetical protein
VGLCPALALLALLEAIAVAVHFEDMDMVGQPIEQHAIGSWKRAQTLDPNQRPENGPSTPKPDL